jgi:bisanhydrobacterioruberin hydratase
LNHAMYLSDIKMTNTLIKQKKYFQLFFIIFYFVGVVGIQMATSRQFFIGLIPYVLLMSFIVILFFHEGPVDKRTILVLFAICLLGFLIEVIGVKTRIIFGNYYYGNGLGIKLLNTPLMIGINWVMLVYCSSCVIDRFTIHPVIKIISASMLMLIYDVIVEHIAPGIDMWYWNKNIVPFQNYLAWFLIAAFFQTVVMVFKIKIKNQISTTIFVCQALFFLSLIVFFNSTK